MCITYSCTWSSVSVQTRDRVQRKGRNSWRERKSALCLGSTSSIPMQVGLDLNKSCSGLRNPSAGSEHPLEPGLGSLINSFRGSAEMQLWSGFASALWQTLGNLHRGDSDTAELLPGAACAFRNNIAAWSGPEKCFSFLIWVSLSARKLRKGWSWRVKPRVAITPWS